MNQEIYQILFRYINQTELKVEDIFNELSSLQCSKQNIFSFIWSFLDLSKGIDIFNENAYSRLRELILYIAQNSEEYRNLFFIFLDRSDTNQIPEINEMRKSFSIISRNTYNIEKYQLFCTNPEGFARLILFFFLQHSDPNDLECIIGEHKIDPDVILNILFYLVSLDKSYHFINFFLPFSPQQVLPFIFQKDYTKWDAFYFKILSFFLQNKRIQYPDLWKIFGEPNEILSEIYSNYIDSIETHCKDLVVIRTILPGFTKEESYPPIFFEHENDCQKYKNELCNSFFFLLLSNSQPFDFELFHQISIFDPCLFPPISETLSNILYGKFLEDPILFLQTEQNLKYLCNLSCYCTENRLIAGICRYPELIPPYIISNFLMQSISYNDCSWQLSIPVFKCLKKYSMHSRRQIYKKFTENQNLIGVQKIKIANATRKITSIFKRLTIENIDKFTMQVAQLFLISPSVASEKLINYIFQIPDITSIPYLIIADLSPLSLDYLLLEICERIETSSITSDWPFEIASFLGNTFLNHYNEMDLEGYISFIKNGLKKFKFPYLCLLKSLIAEMGKTDYLGNLSKSDIELRTGDNLFLYKEKTEVENINEFNFSITHDHLQMLLLRDQTALKLLIYIEHMLQKNDIDDPEKIDELRFTFITICDFLFQVKITNLSPSELIEQFHFSLPAAIKVSHQKHENLQSLSPSEIPSELFGRFWSYNCNCFHLPIEKFKEIDELFQHRIEQTKDPDFLACLNFVREQLSNSMEKQKKRIQSIQLEITKKRWFTSRAAYSLYIGFVNHCIVPRMMFSQEDARYCALFIFSISHYTDFRLNIFNRFFTKKLHFFIFAATFNEARCIGFFLMKLLKYCRNRDEEEELHSILFEKFEILMKHALANNSEFLIKKIILLLDLISKDFPKIKEHEEVLQKLLDDINSSQNQSISIQIKRYIANRKIKVNKRETKEKNLFKQNESDKSEEESEYQSEEESEEQNKRKYQDNDRKYSSSVSRIDSETKSSINSTRLKRSQSRDNTDDSDDYYELNQSLPRSKSTSNSIESPSLHMSHSIDSYLFNASALASYYQMMHHIFAAANSSDLQQQQTMHTYNSQLNLLLAGQSQALQKSNLQTYSSQPNLLLSDQTQQSLLRSYNSQLNLLPSGQTNQQQQILQAYSNQLNPIQNDQQQSQQKFKDDVDQSPINFQETQKSYASQENSIQNDQYQTLQSYNSYQNLQQIIPFSDQISTQQSDQSLSQHQMLSQAYINQQNPQKNDQNEQKSLTDQTQQQHNQSNIAQYLYSMNPYLSYYYPYK